MSEIKGLVRSPRKGEPSPSLATGVCEPSSVVIAALRQATTGRIGAWCAARGLCYEQVRLTMRGKRPPEPAVLAAIGFERVVLYRRIAP